MKTWKMIIGVTLQLLLLNQVMPKVYSPKTFNQFSMSPIMDFKIHNNQILASYICTRRFSITEIKTHLLIMKFRRLTMRMYSAIIHPLIKIQ